MDNAIADQIAAGFILCICLFGIVLAFVCLVHDILKAFGRWPDETPRNR